MPEPLAIGIPAFARLFSLSPAHAYTLAHAGKIPVLHFGDRMVIPMAWVRQRIAEAMQPKADAP